MGEDEIIKKPRTAREIERQLKNDTKLVKEALARGLTTYEKIAESTQLTEEMVILVIRKNKELLEEFREGRSMISDIAADNIHKMILDKNHKDHFQASKFILTKFKSDLDDSMDSQNEAGLGGKSEPTKNRRKVSYKKKEE